MGKGITHLDIIKLKTNNIIMNNNECSETVVSFKIQNGESAHVGNSRMVD